MREESCAPTHRVGLEEILEPVKNLKTEKERRKADNVIRL